MTEFDNEFTRLDAVSTLVACVMSTLKSWMGSMSAAGAAEKDAVAFDAFRDDRPQVDRNRNVGTHGYCMGRQLTMRAAAAVPNRIGAGGAFHGGGLVRGRPTSP